jgi:hypothetical protein
MARSLTWFLPRPLRIRAARTKFLRTQATRGQALDFARLFSLNPAVVSAHSLTLMAAVDQALHSRVPQSPAILKGVCEYSVLRRLQSFWWTPEIVWSHPYADRRLVEFVMAIPFHVLCPPGHPRALMKAALADLLPGRILNRFSKGYAAPYVTRAFRPIAADLLRRVDQLLVVRRGYVDPVLLSTRLRALLAGSAIRFTNLMNIADVEGWFEAHAAHLETKRNAA